MEFSKEKFQGFHRIVLSRVVKCHKNAISLFAHVTAPSKKCITNMSIFYHFLLAFLKVWVHGQKFALEIVEMENVMTVFLDISMTFHNPDFKRDISKFFLGISPPIFNLFVKHFLKSFCLSWRLGPQSLGLKVGFPSDLPPLLRGVQKGKKGFSSTIPFSILSVSHRLENRKLQL